MNPPFSASPNISNRNSEATARHVNAALQRLVPGGRLVTLSFQERSAVALRSALVDRLASLDPIPGALKQLLWHLGHKQVAEVTGRSKRVLKDEAGRLFVD